MTDHELLDRFVADGSDPAFTELARRHLDWVWSAARRQLPEPSLADDVTQAVFLVLARKARSLTHSRRPLAPWLFKVTRYTCSEARRNRERRKYHERRAASMKSTVDEPATPAWEELSPLLDELVNRLSASDRHAILLRFYQGRSLAEVGQALGATEEGARKRVSRAVQKLRGLFAARGIVLPAAALGAAMIPNTTQAAPMTLAPSVGAATATALAMATRTLHLLSLLKLKLAAACLAGVAIVGIGGTLITASLLQAQATTSPSTAPAGAIIPNDLIEIAITDLVGPGIVTRVTRRVDPQGGVSVPLAGVISVSGLTLDQAETKVAKAFSDKNLIRAAHVTVRRIESGTNPSAESRPLRSLDYVHLMMHDLMGPGQEYHTTQQLTDQGTITLPLAGEIQLTGLTEIEAERAISRMYRDQNLVRNMSLWILRITPEQARAEMEKQP